MNLTDREWRTSYRHEDADLIELFYNPALACAAQYDRMTGYFSADALALAARGIAALIANDGRMRLIVGCTLQQPEQEAIGEGYDWRERLETQLLAADLTPPDEAAGRGLEMLAWMVAQGHLDVKVAVPVDPDGRPAHAPGLYHEKVGILTDPEGSRLSFSGSINETAGGWVNNRESFHVHCGWFGGRESAHLEDEVDAFARLWEGRARSVKVFEFPEAARKKLLEFLPSDDRFVTPPARRADREPETRKLLADEFRRIVWTFIREAPRLAHGLRVGQMTSAVTPWQHQVRAYTRFLSEWPSRVLIADQVGLGKTISAGLILRQAILSGLAKRVLILTPKSVQIQWQNELYEKFNLNVPIYDGAALVWKSVHGARSALEVRAFFIRKVSSDGYQIHHQATLKKVVNDRKASLDWDKDTKPMMRKVVREEFERGATIRMELFPEDSTDIDNTPRLRVVVTAPDLEWSGGGALREQIAQWTRKRGAADRDYPAALVWCAKKAGKELQEKAELLLAWHQVQEDIRKGVLGSDFQLADLQSVAVKLKDAQENLLDEVWASYRYVVIANTREQEGLKVIDLGAGHAHNKETLCGRIVAALKTEGYLNESVGAGYLDRSWPEALKDSGAWPLASLRKCFLDGSFTRLLDPDAVLRSRIVEFVTKGEFGLASGARPDGSYDRVWFAEPVGPEEVSFEYNVFLLRKEKAKALQTAPKPSVESTRAVPHAEVQPRPEPDVTLPPPSLDAVPTVTTLKVSGTVPPESWNRFGSKVIPKIRAGEDVRVTVELSCRLGTLAATAAETDIRRILEDLGLTGSLKVESAT